jgi:molybdopterin/thiamine biosynthesis adenylyltransferase
MTILSDRYARQTTLPEIGADGQAKLTNIKILVVGAGGLGAPVLAYLAGAGVGHITVIDHDIVSTNNLHRQTLFTESQIGQSKADLAATFCCNLNKDIDVVAINQRLTPVNAVDLVAAADIVLDCADSFAASYILSDICRARAIPFVSASALGMGGYVGGFCGTAPSLRAVFPDLPQDLASCASAGVLGPVVGVLGSMQAQMALSIILALSPSPLGQLIRYDANTMRSAHFRFDDAPEPATAHGFIDVGAIRDDDLVIELRGNDEAPIAVTPTALRFDVANIATQFPTDTAHRRVVLCCRSGLRAWNAARIIHPQWHGEIALVAAN